MKNTFKMALVLGGKTGLLGQSLAKTLDASGWSPLCPGRDELDVFSTSALEAFLDKNHVQVIFNTIAYTQVDKAESEPEAARSLNACLPEILGRVARSREISLVHYSTDFVFDGRQSHPYGTTDKTRPMSVYGRTKLEGENRLLSDLWPGLRIVRTAWLFGPYKTNFVDKILTLAAQREELRVVHDQIGSPTYTPDLARHSVELLEKCGPGLYHLTNSGLASWCELAAEAVAFAGLHCRIQAISSAEYPQQAMRPTYSVLDNADFIQATGTKPRPWTSALREYVMARNHV